MIENVNDFAKILAVEVLPVPLGPVNKYACDILSFSYHLNEIDLMVSKAIKAFR